MQSELGCLKITPAAEEMGARAVHDRFRVPDVVMLVTERGMACLFLLPSEDCRSGIFGCLSPTMPVWTIKRAQGHAMRSQDETVSTIRTLVLL